MAWTCPVCGSHENDDNELRCSCGHESLIYAPPNYNKIDGGLAFVAAGLLLSSIATASSYTDALAFARGEDKATLLCIGGAMLIIPLVLLASLFKRKRSFPRYIKAWYLFNVAMAYANVRVMKISPYTPGNVERLNDAIDTLVLTSIGCFFWLIYFSFSVRVKKTFVQ